MVEHHRFAVQPRGIDIELIDRLDLLAEFRGPVVARAREKLDRLLLRATIDAHQHAVAVELDFVRPLVAGRRGIDERRQLRLERRRQPRLDRAFDRWRRGQLAQRLRAARRDDIGLLRVGRRHTFFRGGLLRRRHLLCCAFRGRRAPAAFHHTARQRLEHVVFAFAARLVIALLDQQPLLLVAAAAHVAAHERPLAVQLLAVQRELELARLVHLARLRFAAVRLPRAAIPDDHAARAVVAFRYLTFERAVFERMVLDMHRKPLHRRVQARTFRHRPGFQRAVEFEPEVVMQASGVVFLDHIRERVRRLAGSRFCGRALFSGNAGRFRRFVEATLAVVGVESVGHRRGYLWTSGTH